MGNRQLEWQIDEYMVCKCLLFPRRIAPSRKTAPLYDRLWGRQKIKPKDSKKYLQKLLTKRERCVTIMAHKERELSKKKVPQNPEVNEVRFAASVSFSERQRLADPAKSPDGAGTK